MGTVASNSCCEADKGTNEEFCVPRTHCFDADADDSAAISPNLSPGVGHMWSESSMQVGHKRSSVLTPDLEIMRGISLSSTLSSGGHLWRYSPKKFSTEQRMALYSKSKPVEKLDIFISHTWWTPGWQKAAALYLQTAWPTLLVSWLLAISVAFVLSVTRILPMPFIYEANLVGFTALCPFGCWILCFGIFLPLLLSAVLLHLNCHRSPLCFVDVACIHQEDSHLMRRGVQGIGGFLAASRELRVLWSPPYLSRLWCVFELAAFSKANSSGQIVLAPLFVETSVWCLWGFLCVSNVLFWFARSGRGGASILAYFIVLVVIGPATHGLRKSYSSKQRLLEDLKKFDLDEVKCYSEADREFIHSAITDWYGSSEAFTSYVRGPLKRKMLEPILHTQLPLPYLLFLLTPTFSISFETFLALWMGRAPVESLVAWAVGMMLGNNLLWLPLFMVLWIYLCDQFAQPRWPGRCWDVLQTGAVMAVCFLFAAFVSLGSNFSVAYGPVAAICWASSGVAAVLGVLITRPLRFRRRKNAFLVMEAKVPDTEIAEMESNA